MLMTVIVGRSNLGVHAARATISTSNHCFGINILRGARGNMRE